MTQPRITLTSAAQVIAAIPAALRHVPTESVVVLAFVGKVLTFAARFDRVEVVTQAHKMTDVLRRHGVESVVVVTIAERPGKKAAAVENLVVAGILATAVDVIGTYWVPTLAGPAAAQDLDTLATFDVDPIASEVAATTALAGTVIEGSRTAIGNRYAHAEQVHPAEHADAAQVLEELAAVVSADELPDSGLIARTAAVITALPVRDAMFRLPLYGSASAHTVMATIARSTRAEARVQALSIAGWLCHRAGDGAAANIAYDAAEAEATTAGIATPHMLRLLRQALDAAMSPAEIRSLDIDAETVRATTGAHLPGAPDRE
ncbi:DUF4192 family protein [Rhodococcus sp. SORGH_AS_0301]|uniref:DUF4192 family protein n=1 Tax=Rhodococcus sp. SORGH_AS_0301 TaxID=3041780 RepID=UPI0027802A74|nr:DUF4192 family protein [Rhodococcus sp. SORGH_AS_0301]MDQ1178676.1 hypothetical protein [Rhodococcus sp. SORGH_AS_0301]